MVSTEKEKKTLNSGKRTKFTVRDQPVKRAKLERFKQDHPNSKVPESCKYLGDRFTLF